MYGVKNEKGQLCKRKKLPSKRPSVKIGKRSIEFGKRQQKKVVGISCLFGKYVSMHLLRMDYIRFIFGQQNSASYGNKYIKYNTRLYE